MKAADDAMRIWSVDNTNDYQNKLTLVGDGVRALSTDSPTEWQRAGKDNLAWRAYRERYAPLYELELGGVNRDLLFDTTDPAMYLNQLMHYFLQGDVPAIETQLPGRTTLDDALVQMSRLAELGASESQLIDAQGLLVTEAARTFYSELSTVTNNESFSKSERAHAALIHQAFFNEKAEMFGLNTEAIRYGQIRAELNSALGAISDKSIWTSVVNRGIGLLTMLGGAAEVAVAASPMGQRVSPVIRTLIGTHGVDSVWTGARNVSSGDNHSTYTGDVLKYTGLNETQAAVLETFLGLAGGIKLSQAMLRSFASPSLSGLIGPGSTAKSSAEGSTLILANSERKAALQRMAEVLRYRALGWNHEQGKFSIIETMGISRAEQAFGKRFSPSNTEGVDFIDPNGWGNVSLKGPFLDKNLQPLAIEQQLKAVTSIQKHVQQNTAVNTHVIDTLGLSDEAFRAMQLALQNSKVRIIFNRSK